MCSLRPRRRNRAARNAGSRSERSGSRAEHASDAHVRESGTVRRSARRPGASARALPPFKKPLAETLTGMARAEYEAGRLLYVDGDYAGAALKFQRAYEESKDPRLLWNTAAAEKNLRHYAKVVELVERYVAEGGTRLKPEDRAEADALLVTVRAFISTVTLDVQPEGATCSWMT